MINKIKKHRLAFPVISMIAVAAIASITWLAEPVHAFNQDLDKLNRFVQTSNSSGAAIAVFREGRNLIEQEKWDDASKRFTDFIRAYPKDKNLDAALYWLAYSQSRQSQFREAGRQLDRLTKEFPRSSWVDDARALRVEIARHTGDNQVITDELSKDEDIKLIALQSLFQVNRERAVEVATDILKPNSNASKRMKEAAVNMLGRYGDEKTWPMLLSMAGNQAEDDKLREQAIYWIVRQRNDEALGTVIRLYDAEKNPEIKERLMYWLGNSKDERAQAKLNEIARSADDAKTRERAIYWIARRDEGSPETIIRLYDAEKDPQIKERLMYWLARLKDQRAQAKIDEIARSSDDAKMREQAVYWIARRSGDEGVDALIRLFDAEKDPKIKERILYWLGRSKSERVQTKMDEIARTATEPQIRERAIHSIAMREGDQAVITLIRLYDAQPTDGLKERVLYWLGRRGTKPALQKLLEVAKGDGSRSLRERAIHYLARSKDPEAAKLLEQLLK